MIRLGSDFAIIPNVRGGMPAVINTREAAVRMRAVGGANDGSGSADLIRALAGLERASSSTSTPTPPMGSRSQGRGRGAQGGSARRVGGSAGGRDGERGQERERGRLPRALADAAAGDAWAQGVRNVGGSSSTSGGLASFASRTGVEPASPRESSVVARSATVSSRAAAANRAANSPPLQAALEPQVHPTARLTPRSRSTMFPRMSRLYRSFMGQRNPLASSSGGSSEAGSAGTSTVAASNAVADTDTHTYTHGSAPLRVTPPAYVPRAHTPSPPPSPPPVPSISSSTVRRGTSMGASTANDGDENINIDGFPRRRHSRRGPGESGDTGDDNNLDGVESEVGFRRPWEDRSRSGAPSSALAAALASASLSPRGGYHPRRSSTHAQAAASSSSGGSSGLTLEERRVLQEMCLSSPPLLGSRSGRGSGYLGASSERALRRQGGGSGGSRGEVGMGGGAISSSGSRAGPGAVGASSVQISASNAVLHARILFLADTLFSVLQEVEAQLQSSAAGRPAASSTVPASAADVSALPVRLFWTSERAAALAGGEDDEGPQCYICLNEYEGGDSLRVLPCGHEFHCHCVDKWLKEVHKVCPMCRAAVPAAEPRGAEDAPGAAGMSPMARVSTVLLPGGATLHRLLDDDDMLPGGTMHTSGGDATGTGAGNLALLPGMVDLN